MKIIHCADLHLDSRMTSGLTNEQAARRRNELLSAFVHMVEYAADNDVQAILIAGDLFDGKRVSAQAKNTVLESIAAHPEIRFFYLPGNHEGDVLIRSAGERPEGCPENLKTFGKRWTHYELADEDGGGAVQISGVVLCPENAATIYATLMTGAGKYQIVMLHGQLSEYSSKDRAEIIHLGALRGRQIDYLALGHIHSHREGELPPAGFWCYPGCLEGRGFDECGEHGFMLLDIDTAARSAVRTFIPFASRQVIEIPVDITGCMNTMQIRSAIKNRLYALAAEKQADNAEKLAGNVEMQAGNAEKLQGNRQRLAGNANILAGNVEKLPGNGQRLAGNANMQAGNADVAVKAAAAEDGSSVFAVPTARDMVRFVLTGETDVECEKNLDQLDHLLEEEFFAVRIEDRSRTVIDYDAFALDASLKGEFVRLVKADEGLDEERKAEIIRCGICALAGEELNG